MSELEGLSVFFKVHTGKQRPREAEGIAHGYTMTEQDLRPGLPTPSQDTTPHRLSSADPEPVVFMRRFIDKLYFQMPSRPPPTDAESEPQGSAAPRGSCQSGKVVQLLQASVCSSVKQ